jgi:NAD(P)-dependent dehydrogenase (short-subunit alcohol dehydrogenase family)
VTLNTSTAYEIFPAFCAYGISKLAVFELMTYVVAENPNIVAVTLHPSIVDTEMTVDSFKRFALDTPELVGGMGVWLASWNNSSRDFLSGRFVSANWAVEELLRRKNEIIRENLLKMEINSVLRAAQFQQ